VFEYRLQGRTFGGFREQADEKNIWSYLKMGFSGEHLEVFENRLLTRTFGGF
jgi:hypothetical protein